MNLIINLLIITIIITIILKPPIELKMTTVKPTSPENPRVFFDITIGGVEAGKVVMELYANTVPKTAENFRVSIFIFFIIKV